MVNAPHKSNEITAEHPGLYQSTLKPKPEAVCGRTGLKNHTSLEPHRRVGETYTAYVKRKACGQLPKTPYRRSFVWLSARVETGSNHAIVHSATEEDSLHFVDNGSSI